MLLVTIACGAISGFHSLVASGTTSKQIPRMKDARIIGYGGMIAESILAILAVIAVTAGLYWKTAPDGTKGLVYQELFNEGGWIKAFGVGYGQLTKVIFGSLGTLVGITMLKTFIMTTLDTATRITRYIFNELFGETFGLPYMKNKYVSTILVGIISGTLALGNWQSLWPLFGAFQSRGPRSSKSSPLQKQLTVGPTIPRTKPFFPAPFLHPQLAIVFGFNL